MHSTAADGSVAPAEVVAAAHQAGLSAIALTDHDTVDGVAAARVAGDALGVRVVAGVELSAVDDGDEIHVLGLHLAHPEHIAAALPELKNARGDGARIPATRRTSSGLPRPLEAASPMAAPTSS